MKQIDEIRKTTKAYEDLLNLSYIQDRPWSRDAVATLVYNAYTLLALVKERDKRIAGMEDELRGLCWACIHSKPWDKAVFPNLTRTCEHLKERNIMAAGGRAGKDCPYWQWRGTQEDIQK